MLPNWFCSIISVSPRIKKKGGIEHLEAVYAWAASLYYYPVLCEHGKKGGAVLPPPPFFGGNGRKVWPKGTDLRYMLVNNATHLYRVKSIPESQSTRRNLSLSL